MSETKKKKQTCLTVDEVISRLQELEDERGNLPVRLRLPGLGVNPIICGIRYSVDKHDSSKGGKIEIVPRYDVKGSANQICGVNSIVYEMANIQSLFMQFASDIVRVKNALEEFKRKKETVYYNGRNIELVPLVRGEFKRLYEKARDIQGAVNSLKEFDKRMALVVKEPILDSDYPAAFDHHIDMEMSDSEFAKLITNGIGEKTSVQRLAVYVEILRKINTEISNRKRRAQALAKRIKAEASSNEGNNAKVLLNKAESIIATLLRRRDYIIGRYKALKESVFATIAKQDSEIAKIVAEHKDTRKRTL